MDEFIVLSSFKGSCSAELWQDWASLSPFDPTIQPSTEERALIDAALTLGAQLLLVKLGNLPLVRLLWRPTGDTAAFGFFAHRPDVRESILDEAYKILLETGAAQAARSGLKKIVGPMNLNTWFPYRLRTDSEPRSFAWEPQRRPDLQARLEAAGFVGGAKYLSWGVSGFERYLHNTRPDIERCRSRGYTFEALDEKFFRNGGMSELFELSSEAFTENDFFEAIDAQLFERFYFSGSAKSAKSKPCGAMARSPSGKAAGFFYCIYETELPALVLKSTAVARQDRGIGLSNALVYAVAEQLPQIPDLYIPALVREGIQSESYSQHGNVIWKHQYEIFSKDIGN